MSPHDLASSCPGCPIESLYEKRLFSYSLSIGDKLERRTNRPLARNARHDDLEGFARGEMHGLGISRRIEQITKGTFQVKPGSLFPSLHRMEEEGWISGEWGESENNRRAKYYRLTKAGRRQLEKEAERWSRISLAVARALEAS